MNVDIEPASILFGDRFLPSHPAHSMNFGESMPGSMNDMSRIGVAPTANPAHAPVNLPSIILDENGQIAIPNLASFVSFNGNLPLFNAHPALKKLVVLATDRAIREACVFWFPMLPELIL